MSSQPSPSSFLVLPDEYLDRERYAQYKSKYFAGEIVAMAGAKRKHNLVTTNTAISSGTQLRDKPCELYSNDMRVQADGEKQYSYPDVVVVCGEPQFRDGREDTLLNPTVILEVLSPSTEARDRGEKFLRSRQIASLMEYILISQNERRVERFTKQPDGSWRLTEMVGDGTVRLEALGCTLLLDDVYRKVSMEPLLRLVSDEPR